MTTTPDPCTCYVRFEPIPDHELYLSSSPPYTVVRCSLCASAGLMRDALAAIDAWNTDRCPICQFGPWEGSENHLANCPMPRARAALAAATTPTDTGSHV